MSKDQNAHANENDAKANAPANASPFPPWLLLRRNMRCGLRLYAWCAGCGHGVCGRGGGAARIDVGVEDLEKGAAVVRYAEDLLRMGGISYG